MNVLGHFTTITISLSKRIPQENTFPQPGTSYASAFRMAKGAKKILLVEDNENFRELLCLFIRRLGYQVFEAATGLEAIDRASAVHPDLIMMDISLPKMTGDEATACLKANPATREIPVIINTAFAFGPYTKRALDSGAAEVLHKPFQLTMLHELLSRYLPADDQRTTTVAREELRKASVRNRKNSRRGKQVCEWVSIACGRCRLFGYLLWAADLKDQQSSARPSERALFPCDLAFILNKARQGSWLMSTIVCSQALRAIGQDLELRGIKTFVIRCEADRYIVEAGYQSPPAPTPVTLHYTFDDIEQLDRDGRHHRGSGAKDFLSLSQILRAIGSYASRKGTRLLSVSNSASTETMPVVKIEYETAQGEPVVDDCTGSAIYDMCVTVYKLRGRPNINAGYARWQA
jgi:two-component system, cell cycle response regulator DivK